jgi:hypothetical protein
LAKKRRLPVIARVGVFSLIGLGVVIWILCTSKPFQQCVHEVKQKTAEQALPKRVSKISLSVGAYRECGGEFVHNNGEAVTAIFTVVLALSTIGLWGATRNLYEAGERQIKTSRQIAAIQARQTRASIREARRSADAATESGDTAKHAFSKLERPYVFLFGVRALESGDGFPFIKFSVANYGKTPAIIENFRALASITGEPEPPLRVDDRHPLFSSPIISAGERRDNLQQAADIPYRSTPLKEIVPRLDDPKNDLFLWMIINYRSPFTKGHETSACWRYDRNIDRFVQYGHEDYNHET